MKTKALFNISRLLNDSGKEDISPEVSFLQDFDFTVRKMNSYGEYYKFKQITKEENPEYFDDSKGSVNISVIDKLPDVCTSENDYNKNHILYHTNDQKYYIGVYKDGKPSRRYKPSSMNCLRNMYYQIIGADLDKQQQKSSDFYGICESGTDRHKRIQYAITQMQKYGIDCEYVDVETYIKSKGIEDLVVESKEDFETKVYDKKRNIIFLCDGLIKYKGEYYILEIKTESSFKWLDRSYVDDKHRNQAYTYSLELGLDKVLFLYENRDVCTKKPYILNVSQENRDYIVNRVSECDKYVDSGIVPPIEQSITSKICQYCDYRTQCKLDNKKCDAK